NAARSDHWARARADLGRLPCDDGMQQASASRRHRLGLESRTDAGRTAWNRIGSIGALWNRGASTLGLLIQTCVWGQHNLMENLSDLEPDLAARWGIEMSYFDVQGRRHETSPEVARRVIEALKKSRPEPVMYPDTGGNPQPAFQGDGRRCWVLAVQ